MSTIAKRTRRDGSASYLARWYRLDGVQVSRTCPDLATARRLLAEVGRAKALGVDWSPAAPAGAQRLEPIIADYLAEMGRIRSLGTVRHAAYMLGYWLEHVGQDATVEALSRATLSAWWAAGQAAGLQVSTLRNRAGAVLRLWEWAADSDAYAAATPRPRTFAMPSVPRVITVAPTWAECDAVIRALRDTAENATASKGVAWRLAVIMRCTGLRREQATHLTWADVDLARATLTVRPELGKTRSEKAGRRVPLAPGLVTELSGWGVREGRLCGASGRALATNTGKPIYAAVARLVASGVIRADAWVGRGCHGFRRAFVSELERAGASSEAVEYLVGHDLSTRGRYLDPDAMPLRAAVALVTAVDWSGVIAPRPIGGWRARAAQDKITVRSRHGGARATGRND